MKGSMNMKKWIALLLCLTMALALCGTALAESGTADGEQTDEEIMEDKVQELLGHTAAMSDREIRDAFRRIAEESDIKLTDKDLDHIVKVCRSLESLSSGDLSERVELMAENFYNGLVETPDKFMSWLEDVSSGKYTLEDAKNDVFNGFGQAAGILSEIFSGLSDFFNGLRPEKA